jgi:hypothetical protein
MVHHTTHRQRDTDVLQQVAHDVRGYVSNKLKVTYSANGVVKIAGCPAKIVCTVTEELATDRISFGYSVTSPEGEVLLDVGGDELAQATAFVLCYPSKPDAVDGPKINWLLVSRALVAHRLAAEGTPMVTTWLDGVTVKERSTWYSRAQGKPA